MSAERDGEPALPPRGERFERHEQREQDRPAPEPAGIPAAGERGASDEGPGDEAECVGERMDGSRAGESPPPSRGTQLIRKRRAGRGRIVDDARGFLQRDAFVDDLGGCAFRDGKLVEERVFAFAHGIFPGFARGLPGDVRESAVVAVEDAAGAGNCDEFTRAEDLDDRGCELAQAAGEFSGGEVAHDELFDQLRIAGLAEERLLGFAEAGEDPVGGAHRAASSSSCRRPSSMRRRRQDAAFHNFSRT